MKLNELQSNMYFIAVYIREHTTVFYAETVAESPQQAKSHFGYRLRNHMRDNKWRLPKGTMELAKVFDNKVERNDYLRTFRNAIKV